MVVSHDRYFVNEVAKRVVHIGDGIADEFVGSYEDYLASLRDGDTTTRETATSSRKAQRREAAELRKKMAAATEGLRSELVALESTIETLEETAAACELLMQDNSLYTDPTKSLEVTQRYQRAKSEAEDALEKWAELQLQIEAIEAEFE